MTTDDNKIPGCCGCVTPCAPVVQDARRLALGLAQRGVLALQRRRGGLQPTLHRAPERLAQVARRRGRRGQLSVVRRLRGGQRRGRLRQRRRRCGALLRAACTQSHTHLRPPNTRCSGGLLVPALRDPAHGMGTLDAQRWRPSSPPQERRPATGCSAGTLTLP